VLVRIQGCLARSRFAEPVVRRAEQASSDVTPSRRRVDEQKEEFAVGGMGGDELEPVGRP
jgi:hypothetical protein